MVKKLLFISLVWNKTILSLVIPNIFKRKKGNNLKKNNSNASIPEINNGSHGNTRKQFSQNINTQKIVQIVKLLLINTTITIRLTFFCCTY